METWIAVILGVCGVAMVALWLSGGSDAESDGQAAANRPRPGRRQSHEQTPLRDRTMMCPNQRSRPRSTRRVLRNL